MKELAEEWQCDASTATWSVDRLQRLELAERQVHPADRRGAAGPADPARRGDARGADARHVRPAGRGAGLYDGELRTLREALQPFAP